MGGFVDSRGKLISEKKHNTYERPSKFYDNNSGALVKNQYFNNNGKWYYADAQGNILTGPQTIDGVHVYFDSYGVQAKDAIAEGYYYDKDSGARHAAPRKQFIKAGGKLYYLDDDNKINSGYKKIDGKDYFITGYGEVLRGEFGPYGYEPYYDSETGAAVRQRGFVKSGRDWYYLDDEGNKALGLAKIDGNLYYFSNPVATKYRMGEQVKGKLVRPYEFLHYNRSPYDNPAYYFDAETGAAVTNQYVNWKGNWYYFGNDGKALLFDQVINGQHLYFNYEGKQVKGNFVTDYKGTRYYDENSGELVTNQTRTINGVTYHFDENGRTNQL